MRPVNVLDVKRGKVGPFSRLPRLVNLYRAPRVIEVPVRRTLAGFSLLGVLAWFVVGSVAAPIVAPSSFAAEATTQEEEQRERQELEAELRRLEEEMGRQEQTIQTLRTQGRTLQTEIQKLNAQSKKLALQIQAVEFSLSKLNKEIAANTAQVRLKEDQLALNRGALVRAMQSLYESDRSSLLEVFLGSAQLSDFFGNLTSLAEVQGSLASTVEKISEMRAALLEEQEQLAFQKNDAETLKAYRDSQRRSVEGVKKDKAQLLNVTKGKESEYQELLKETRKTAAQIRSRIFELLGGGELTFDEAYKFAKYAEQATGVRAALILAVLDRESALGQNVGRCTYKTAMHPTRDIPPFLALTAELGINPASVTVSCANRDGLYGGAMGPAQFIPSTWNLYKDKIKDITGSNPPSPWRNADAFVATALYLKDAGAAGAALAGERVAAAKYYAGQRWRRYLWTYGDRVVTRAQQFEQDIKILNS